MTPRTTQYKNTIIPSLLHILLTVYIFTHRYQPYQFNNADLRHTQCALFPFLPMCYPLHRLHFNKPCRAQNYSSRFLKYMQFCSSSSLSYFVTSPGPTVYQLLLTRTSQGGRANIFACLHGSSDLRWPFCNFLSTLPFPDGFYMGELAGRLFWFSRVCLLCSCTNDPAHATPANIVQGVTLNNSRDPSHAVCPC